MAVMAKNLLIVGLLLVAAVLTARLVHVENQRYALLLGMCREEATPGALDIECLRTVQTRTSWTWHLYYAFTD